jgi:proline iminopeptidase
MHYALRHPDRVSHMILMNTAPACHDDLELMRQERHRRWAPHQERLDALTSSAAYEDGDPDAVAEFYRIDFGTTFKRPEDLRRLNVRWTREDILKGRAIEDRLAQESSAHIAAAIPGANFTTLRDSGHFSYIDAPEQVHEAIDVFFEHRRRSDSTIA